jgi:hypothetical protein
MRSSRAAYRGSHWQCLSLSFLQYAAPIDRSLSWTRNPIVGWRFLWRPWIATATILKRTAKHMTPPIVSGCTFHTPSSVRGRNATTFRRALRLPTTWAGRSMTSRAAKIFRETPSLRKRHSRGSPGGGLGYDGEPGLTIPRSNSGHFSLKGASEGTHIPEPP